MRRMESRSVLTRQGLDQRNEESAALTKIAEMLVPFRVIGEKLQTVIKANAPSLSPKLWNARLFQGGLLLPLRDHRRTRALHDIRLHLRSEFR